MGLDIIFFSYKYKKIIQTLAPIILFTYNRPVHTQITLNYLKTNPLADQSTLYIYCDGAKENTSKERLQNIKKVEAVVREQQWTKEVIVVVAKENMGLAKNVITGVTEVVNKHGKAIVLEDDLKVGKNFLTYMNQALDKYENETTVKQISGFLFPLNLKKKNRTLFLPMTNTIGWGTWKRVWNEIDFTAEGYEILKSDRAIRHRFNLDGSYDYAKMLIKQLESKNYGSWGIRYYWSVFNNNGLVLYPDYPMIQHNDFDSSGTHLSDYQHYDQLNWQNDYQVTKFSSSLDINYEAFAKLKRFTKKHNRLTLKKIARKLKLIINRKLKI